ncbi:MAG: type I secretion C-terminal target domain-containing protein [Leptolyngbyaceae cyanobacterium SM1_3_5]|nr:type I secretion C-terminal target domain-containing protein [Leptolyngbyaceae cyanobacterium SM1_3_5]
MTTLTFSTRSTLAAGLSPFTLAAGDFNGDGRPDLVASGGNDTRSVLVLLNNGSGSFLSQTPFAVGDDPEDVKVGDFNADGRLDLAVANNGDASVSVLLNNGSGGFLPQSVFATGLSPFSIAVSDFNSDGRLDLAVGSESVNGSVSVLLNSVLLNNGSGGFLPQSIFAVSGSPFSIAVGDFNGDSRPDITAANFGTSATSFSDASVSVLLNNGSGGFLPQITFPFERSPGAVAVADLNGDGKLDIATANSGGSATVLINTTVFPTPTPTPTDGVLGTALPPINFRVNRGVVLRSTRRNRVLQGTPRKDRLFGSASGDRLIGRQSDDQIIGDRGNDTLNGDAGNDVLIGGAGADLLDGGTGRDMFVYERVSDGNDAIVGFRVRQDLIDLRQIFSQSAFQVAGASDFSRLQQFVRLSQVGASTRIQIDADGVGARTNFVTLATLRNLPQRFITSRDFVVR